MSSSATSRLLCSRLEEWKERYNAKRKAKMEAAKAAIKAEDMGKGIFTTVSQLPKQEPHRIVL